MRPSALGGSVGNEQNHSSFRRPNAQQLAQIDQSFPRFPGIRRGSSPANNSTGFYSPQTALSPPHALCLPNLVFPLVLRTTNFTHTSPMVRLSLLFICFSLISSAAVILPDAVDASSTFFTYNAASLIDGQGITNGLQDADFTHMWLSDNTFPGVDPYSGTLTFTFNNPATIAALQLWNYNYPGDAGDALSRGTQTFEILYLTGGNFTSLGQFTLLEGTGLDLASQTFTLPNSIVTSQVQLNLLTNYGDRDYIGLGEVQFLSTADGPVTPPNPGNPPGPSAVPEPVTGLYVAAGLASAVLLRRRVRRA